MRVAAPGKLVLTGAYAVLEGGPAIVMAVDRLAVADDRSPSDRPPLEVAVAFAGEPAPTVDVAALCDDAGSKLGLGSSAAGLVAALGTRFARRGGDLASSGVRQALLAAARDAHARAQGGGSGADVAASVSGGVLRYTMAAHAPIALPAGLRVAVLASGRSARTSEMRAAVDGLRRRDARRHRACLGDLAAAAEAAADARELGPFLAAAVATQAGLAALGVAAGCAIVPPAFAELAAHAAADAAVFLPSGAGGGDVGVHLAAAPPSARFLERARRLGLHPLALAVDRDGVRVLEA